MFNLIMLNVTWDAGKDSMPLGRIFEYTADHVEEQFRDKAGPSLNRMIEHPCLFMREGTGEEVARVGAILKARLSGKEVAFEYALDQEVPPLLNSMIFAKRTDFDMPNDFEFSRNHWAMKDVDLYRLLLRLVRPRRQRPSVFTITEHERIEPELVSAMMPFSAEFSATYESIKQASESVGLRCRRADDIWEAPSIIQDIVSLIDRSRVVICDCTGRNPNVFYEAGIAHTLGREVVLITQRTEDIPFDLRHLRYIPYLNNAEGRQSLSRALSARLRTIIDR